MRKAQVYLNKERLIIVNLRKSTIGHHKTSYPVLEFSQNQANEFGSSLHDLLKTTYEIIDNNSPEASEAFKTLLKLSRAKSIKDLYKKTKVILVEFDGASFELKPMVKSPKSAGLIFDDEMQKKVGVESSDANLFSTLSELFAEMPEYG